MINKTIKSKRVRLPVKADIQFNLLKQKPRFKLYEITNVGQTTGYFLSRHFDDLFFSAQEEGKAREAFERAARKTRKNFIMTSLQKQRLFTLIRAAEEGRLGHKFSFGQFSCGGLGCLLGACPNVFPDDWGFAQYWGRKIPCARGGEVRDSVFAAMEFFGLTMEEAHALFYPSGVGRGNPHYNLQIKCGLPILFRDAPLEKVVKNLRTFLENKENEKERE